MQTPLVSIIIPIFNRENLIKETLDSILQQSYLNWECIIVDDGSTDKTIEVVRNYIKKDSRFNLFQRPLNRLKGGNAARNFGFEKSKGQLIQWFDSDDIMLSNFITEKVNAFNDSTQAVLHRNRYANYILTRFRESKYSYSTSSNLFYHYCMEEIEIQTCGFMWKKDFLNNLQLFDEKLERYQDNEFHIRVLSLKPKIVILDAILAIIRGGDGDTSQISSKSNLNKKKLFDVFYSRYQVLLLMDKADINQYHLLLNKNYKKTLWAFYEVVLFEKNIVKRFKDVFTYYDKLTLIYFNKDIPIIEKLKSHLYLIYILIFGKSFLPNK